MTHHPPDANFTEPVDVKPSAAEALGFTSIGSVTLASDSVTIYSFHHLIVAADVCDLSIIQTNLYI